MEDDEVSYKKLLVARSYKEHKIIMEGCDVYQRMKNRTEVLAGKLMTNEVSEKL